MEEPPLSDGITAYTVMDAVRVAAALTLLLWASVQDLRTRLVKDAVWAVMLAVAVPLLIVQIILADQGLVYLIAVIPPVAFMVPAMVGIPELREMARGNPEDLAWGALIIAGIAAFIAEFFVFDFALELDNIPNVRFGVAMVVMPVLILVVYALYATGLIHGGADAKAIMGLVVLFPFFPDLGYFGLPLIEPTGAAVYIKMIFPFAITVLFNAVFVFIFVPLGFFIVNAARRELSGGKSFFGYKVDVERLADPKRFLWLMETTERRLPGPGGKVIPARSSVMALKDIKPEKEVRWFRKAGIKRVWVTPKIPFIVPILGGLIFAVILGNIFFLLFGLVLG